MSRRISLAGGADMKRVWIALAALLIGLAASLFAAPSASAFCAGDPGTGDPCGRCPELKIIKIYCLQ
jgi:hypothetical protein